MKLTHTLLILSCLAFLAMADPPTPQNCSYLLNDCPDDQSCDLLHEKCYHTPRWHSEPCELTNCSATDPLTGRAMVCLDLCYQCEYVQPSMTHDTTRYSLPKGNLRALATLAHCGFTGANNTVFVNFGRTVETNMPVMYPKNDQELKQLLDQIASKGCVARPVGATHSDPPIVSMSTETNTVGVSLAEYAQDGDWNFKLNTTSSKVRALAGKSLFDLYQFMRPKGYFLQSSTAGAIFALAGVVSNSVHGGFYNVGWIQETVSAVRVATLNNNNQTVFREIHSEDELKHWRNSYGLLGMIVGIEFSVVRRDHFKMETVTRQFDKDFNKQEVNNWFDYLESQNIYSETFFDPYNKELVNIVFKNSDPRVPSKTEAEYQAEYTKLAPAFVNVRKSGSPVQEGSNEVTCLLAKISESGLPSLLQDFLANAYYTGVFSTIEGSVDDAGEDVNDGFWLRNTPNQIKLAAYSIPAGLVFEQLSAITEVFEQVKKETGIKMIGNAEFRFHEVNNSKATLTPQPANGQLDGTKYVNCELVYTTYAGQDVEQWQKGLAYFEKKMRSYGGIPHTGKSFCYDVNHVPYADTACVKSIFTSAQKQTFETYRATQDPNKVFWGGYATTLVTN